MCKVLILTKNVGIESINCLKNTAAMAVMKTLTVTVIEHFGIQFLHRDLFVKFQGPSRNKKHKSHSRRNLILKSCEFSCCRLTMVERVGEMRGTTYQGFLCKVKVDYWARFHNLDDVTNYLTIFQSKTLKDLHRMVLSTGPIPKVWIIYTPM